MEDKRGQQIDRVPRPTLSASADHRRSARSSPSPPTSSKSSCVASGPTGTSSWRSGRAGWLRSCRRNATSSKGLKKWYLKVQKAASTCPSGPADSRARAGRVLAWTRQRRGTNVYNNIRTWTSSSRFQESIWTGDRRRLVWRKCSLCLTITQLCGSDSQAEAKWRTRDWWVPSPQQVSGNSS